MKKFTRILSVALVAMMVLSLAAVASAETPSVYIPNRLAKLVDAYVEDYVFPTLVTKGDIKVKRDANGKEIAWRLNTDDGVMHFQFSEKPDWAGAVVSSLDGGWINLDVDDSGYAEMELEGLHRQPGMYSWSNTKVTYWDKDCKLRFRTDWTAWEGGPSYKKGELVPKRFYGWLYGNGGDYPYSAGKDYGDYSVTVNYNRDGSASKVAVSLKDVDLFETGMEGAVSTITFELVNVELDCYKALYQFLGEDPETGVELYKKVKPNNKWVKTIRDEEGNIEYIKYLNEIYDVYTLSSTDVWYVSSVSATYPEGNYIVGAEADYKNDAKNNLSQYKISFAVNETDVAQIYYKPWDTPFYGQYSKNGTVIAVSGSGNNLNKWYKFNGTSEQAEIKKPVKDEKTGEVIGYTLVTVDKVNNNGKQVKSIKKGINSYKSPRVTTK